MNLIDRLPDLTPIRTVVALPPDVPYALVRVMPGKITIAGFGYVSDALALPTRAVSFLFTPQTKLGAVVSKRIRRGEHPLCFVEQVGTGFAINITFEPDRGQEDERIAVDEWQRDHPRQEEGHR